MPKSSCIANVRFSYGPPMHNLVTGMKNMKVMIDKWTKNPMPLDDYVTNVAKEEQAAVS